MDHGCFGCMRAAASSDIDRFTIGDDAVSARSVVIAAAVLVNLAVLFTAGPVTGTA